MNDLKLTFGCVHNCRISKIVNKEIKPDGIDLDIRLYDNYPRLFGEMFNYEAFDVSELSMSGYIKEKSENKNRFIAIPVFPSRMFRHSFIFINKNSSINKPADLKYCKVGIPDYSSTASLWIRGLLSDEYGVNSKDIKWLQGPLEDKSEKKQMEILLPAEFDIEPIDESKTLSQMLINQEIEAIISPKTPLCYKTNPQITRLFEDAKSLEIEYYKKTKIFPIMHTLIIKNNIYEMNPWIAKCLYQAFEEAKNESIKDMYKSDVLNTNLIWELQALEEQEALFGEKFWHYGIEYNRIALNEMLKYSYEQGLSARRVSIDELFCISGS